MSDSDGEEPLFGDAGASEWLLRPVMDESAPLLLRANCMRSLAVLANGSAAHRSLLSKSKESAGIAEAAMNIMSLVDSRLEPLKHDSDKHVSILAHRLTNIARLHAMTLLTSSMPTSDYSRLGKSRRQFGLRTATEIESPEMPSRLIGGTKGKQRLQQGKAGIWV